MTSRRSFLLGLSGALAAPAIVKAESLMKLWVPKPKIITSWDIGLGDISVGCIVVFDYPSQSWQVNNTEATGPFGVVRRVPRGRSFISMEAIANNVAEVERLPQFVTYG